MRNRIGMLIAACAAMIFVTTPAVAQRANVGKQVQAPSDMRAYVVPAAPVPYSQAITSASGNFCAWAPAAFTCQENQQMQQETCFTACMTPAEWELCPTKSWFADSYDHRDAAPIGATPANRIRFFERCGTVCRPMGFARMAYWYEPRRMTDGSWHEGRWIVFPFSPPRSASRN